TMHIALLDAAARDGVLDADDDDIAHRGGLALRAAEHFDALHAARTRVIGDIEVGLHLNHGSVPTASHLGRHTAGLINSTYAGAPTLTFSSTRQVFSFDTGRHSSIRTTSPTLQSLLSSWAWYFLERRTTLPTSG